MNTRVALIGIMVENENSVIALNSLLHEYGTYIIVNIISVAIDAPADIINALSGKIGRLEGIGVKTIYANISETEHEKNN